MSTSTVEKWLEIAARRGVGIEAILPALQKAHGPIFGVFYAPVEKEFAVVINGEVEAWVNDEPQAETMYLERLRVRCDHQSMKVAR